MKKRRNAGKKKRTKAHSRQNKAAMLCITFVVSVLLVVLLFEGHSLKLKIDANDRKTAQLEQKIAEENQRTKDINDLQSYMQSDEYLEKAAKEKLGLIKDNEILFKESQ
ncbi:septum formation initiator family protein [Novisyntrophococcus fermenticellae]|uniref:septum formation initiator family protein n=1 Tax=Novisyntrophococcus fermenticellae TaxID=2068655 RepID=UPI001E30219F|nr:septum formation initiator family protein [Novisyntrophococcus fermenticellae]